MVVMGGGILIEDIIWAWLPLKKKDAKRLISVFRVIKDTLNVVIKY